MADIWYILRNLLGLSPQILKWPFVLTSLIIPFIAFTYALKLALEKLRIFKSDAVNYGLAGLASFSSIFFISSIGPFIFSASVFMIWTLKRGTRLKALVVGLIMAVAAFYGILFFAGYLIHLASQ